MKAYLFPIMAAAASVVFLTACASQPVYVQPVFPVCEGRYRSSLGPVGSLYVPVSSPSCRQYSPAKDVSAWLESPLNSHRQRGLKTLVLGCANLTPSAAACEYGGPDGHAATLDMVFDFTRYNDRIRVRRAVLGVYAHSNAPFLAGAAGLRGRLTAGDDYQALAAVRTQPSLPSGWILFDITDLAARAVADRRDSVAFELSLPCTRDESNLSVVGVLNREPVILVEYL
jgi:hypothetical protein